MEKTLIEGGRHREGQPTIFESGRESVRKILREAGIASVRKVKKRI